MRNWRKLRMMEKIFFATKLSRRRFMKRPVCHKIVAGGRKCNFCKSAVKKTKKKCLKKNGFVHYKKNGKAFKTYN